MKRSLAIGMLLAAAAAAMTAGCATNPTAEQRLAAQTTGKAAAEAHCVRETGSRIKPKEGECVGPGRAYSQDELQATGTFDTAEALKKLDPAIQ